jgi:cell division protein FtsA
MFGRKRSPDANLEKTYLALDIGTEFIKTAVFAIRNGQVEVLGYDRAPQRQNAMMGALIINLDNVIDVVDQSIGQAVAMAKELTQNQVAIPRKVIMGIAGELVKGVPIVVNVDRENPDKKITQKEIDGILHQIRTQTFAEAKSEIAEDTGIKTAQITEIDTVINSVYIDGIKVDSPLGFTGQGLIYRVFSTFAPKIHVDSIKEVAKALNLEIMKIVVEPYALAMGVENSRQEKFSAVFIDIGGGTTDIAFVQRGAIVGTKMYAFGGRVFTKRIERELNLDYLAAEQMKIDYSDQKLNKTEQRAVQLAVAKDMNVWVDGVELSLAEFDDIEEYPSQFYLCGGGSLLPEVQQRLLSHPWLQVLPFGKFPRINFLFPNQIANVIDRTKKVTNTVDVTPMALARMALDIVND